MDIKNTKRAEQQPESKLSGAEQGAEMDKWADFAGSLCASIGGAITYAVASKFKLTPLLKLTAVAGSGMALRPAAKSTFENAFVDPQYHTTGLQDCGWGAVDGLSGIFAAAAEAKVGSAFAQRLGQNALGRTVSSSVAEEAGKRVINNTISQRFAYNAIRITTGGAAGTASFSLPHSLYDHRAEIAADPVAGLRNVAGQVLPETATGALIGGAFSPVFSAIGGRREIFAKITDSLKPKSGLTPYRILHFNDLHSNLLYEHSLGKLGTVADEIRNSTTGRSTHLFSLGDEYSGNAISNFTENGKLENQAINLLKPTATIPGNHAVDRIGAKAGIEDWIEIVDSMAKTDQGGVSKVLAANVKIEVPGREGFVGANGVVKPHRIVEIETPTGGREKVGLIGLVTNELEVEKNVVVTDPVAAAQKSIKELRSQGVNKIVALSHMGFAADRELAKNVDGLSAIVGAHSHDATPVPQWITHKSNGRSIPIVQAGSEAKWLGDLQLTFNQDGSANRFHTSGKLHPVGDIAEHPEVKKLIEDSVMAREVRKLEQSDAFSKRQIDRAFPFGATRTSETALGNLVSDAQMAGINKALSIKGEAPISLFLKHTGDIRKGLHAGKEMNGFHLSNVFCNGDNVRELCVANMTGRSIKAALEFGVKDLAPPPTQRSFFETAKTGLKNFVQEAAADKVDPSGNFLQGSGFRYKFDLSRPEGKRVFDIQVWNGEKNAFENLHADQNYKIGTLLHPIDKWAKNGVFKGIPEYDALVASLSPMRGEKAIKDAAHDYVNSKLVGLSQPRLLDEHLGNPANLEVAGRVGMRVQDVTARPWRASASAMAAHSAMELFSGASMQPDSMNATIKGVYQPT